MPAPNAKTRVANGRIKDVMDLREKATLLLSEETPFFQLIKDSTGFSHIDRHSCEAIYGVNIGTLSTWKNGIPKIGINSSSLAALSDRINEIYASSSEAMPARFPANLNFLIGCNKYEFGELLGVQWRDTRRILDQTLYVKSLATSLLTMPTRHTIALDDFKGVCIAWHMTPTRTDSGLEYRLVRSFLDICDPVERPDNNSVYRCRWRLPYIKKNRHNKNLPHYHYLGSVSYTRENDTFTWLFEPKNAEAVEGSPDFPYLLTQTPAGTDTQQFGFYTSKCQDGMMYTSSIAICKINEECEGKLTNTAEGLLEYQRFIDNIIANSIFKDIDSAKAHACCKNEIRLLEAYIPVCDVFDSKLAGLNVIRSKLEATE